MIYENSSDLEFSMANNMQCESEDECDSDENIWDGDFSDTEEEDEFPEKKSHSYLIDKPLPPEPGTMVSNYDVPRIHYEAQPCKDDLPVGTENDVTDISESSGEPLSKIGMVAVNEENILVNDELYDAPDTEISGNRKLRDVYPKGINKRNLNAVVEESNIRVKSNSKQKNLTPEIIPKKPSMQLTQNNSKISESLLKKIENGSMTESNDLYEDPNDSPLSGDAFMKQLMTKIKPQTQVRVMKESNENKRDIPPSNILTNIPPSSSLDNNQATTVQQQFQDRPLPVFPPIGRKPPQQKLAPQPGPAVISPSNPLHNIKKLQVQDRRLPILPNDNEKPTKMESTQQQQNEKSLPLDEQYEICDQQNILTNLSTQQNVKTNPSVQQNIKTKPSTLRKPADSQNILTNPLTQCKPDVKGSKPMSTLVSEQKNNTWSQPRRCIPTPENDTGNYTYVPTDNVPLFPQNISVQKVVLPQPGVYEPPDVGITSPVISEPPSAPPVLRRHIQCLKNPTAADLIEKNNSINIVSKPLDLPSRQNMPPKPKPKISEPVTVEPAVAEKPVLPKRTIQPTPKPVIGDQLSQISEKMWYHGDINREESVNRLKSWNKESSFLVRDTDKWDGYSLSIFHNRNVTHLRITLKDNHYYLGTSEKPFKSVESLIGFYQTTTLSLASGGEICLKTTPPRIKDTK